MNLGSLKKSVISKIKRKIGEFLLPPEQQSLLRRLFSSSEQDQLDAACSLGKIPDVNLLCLLQFYLQDSFLDELLAGLPGREFRMELAEKKAIKFYSRMAASMMLSEGAFFSYVLQVIRSPAVEAEERCDLACAVGSVFESFGPEAEAQQAVGENSGGEFVRALMGIIASPEEKEEVRAACAIALKKAVCNPEIGRALGPQLAKSALEQLEPFNAALDSGR